MFRGETVVHRDHRHVEFRRDFGAKAVMAFQVADHETAAVEEDDRGTGLAGLARIIEAQRDVTGGAGAGEVADHGKVARRLFGELAHCDIAGARRFEAELAHRRGIGAVQEIEESLNIGAHVVGGLIRHALSSSLAWGFVVYNGVGPRLQLD